MSAPNALASASVLVVEDQTFVRDLLERLLTSLPVAQVAAARSAEDALALLDKSPEMAHVALVDYELPGINGIQLIERLRGSSHRTLRDLPVIMLTSHNDVSLYQDAVRLGISAFLAKPAGTTALKAALEDALSGRRVAPPVAQAQSATVRSS